LQRFLRKLTTRYKPGRSRRQSAGSVRREQVFVPARGNTRPQLFEFGSQLRAALESRLQIAPFIGVEFAQQIANQLLAHGLKFLEEYSKGEPAKSGLSEVHHR